MCTNLTYGATLFVCLLYSPVCLAEDVLFEDAFKKGLSNKWQLVGLKKEDYRFRDGGIELRVQSGKLTRHTPMLKVVLPFTSSDTVVASVRVTILDKFTEPEEFAGLYLTDEDGRDFGARKQQINGQLSFTPPKYEFIGEGLEQGGPENYARKFWPANDDAGPLRIIVRNHYAYFQVGPSAEGRYLNFFHSAIQKSQEKHGFALVAAGAPSDAIHWVRFDDFRVTK